MSFAAIYAEAEARLGACPIECGALGSLVDNECRHGRLPGDRTPPCGCWPNEPEPTVTPDLMGVLSNAQEAIMDTEAPFGYKADGVTPRKRPAPPPHVIEAARQAKRAKAAKRAEAKAAEATATTPAPSIEVETRIVKLHGSPFVAQMLAELDAEIERLTAVKAKLEEVVA